MAYIGNTVENQGFTPAIDYFNGDGVTVTFTLSRPIASVAQVIVAIDNVIQNPSSSYTVAGSAITFSSAPLSGTNNIWVEYTSLITTYQGISQDPTVIGDIRATGGYLAEGDFGNSFVDGAILDYVTGNGRVTVGSLDDITFYHGGTAGRSEIMKLSYAGNSTLAGNLAISGSATIQGLTVGKGGGAVSNNTVVGSNAGVANTTGKITAVGYLAARFNTTGSGNTAVGGNDNAQDGALYLNTTGNYNIAVGTGAVASNTTGSSNTGLGYSALQNNTTADNNTAVGYTAMYTNTTGQGNTALGRRALYFNTTASNSTAIGNQALYNNTTGTQNTAVGVNALTNNTTGGNNVAVGLSSLEASTTGASNTAIGENAGAGITTGQYNNIIGSRNTTLTTGEYNIQIGRFANASASSVSYSLMINTDNTARTDKGSSTGFIFVGGSIYQGNNSASWATTSDQRLKKNIVDNTTGLDLINQIQVRNFEYRLPEEITDLPKDQAIAKKGIQLGVIAQEIQQVSEEFVKTETTGVMSVDSDNLTWYLINAVKELNAKVEAQALEIATLKAAK